jgi:hypothetical protein
MGGKLRPKKARDLRPAGKSPNALWVVENAQPLSLDRETLGTDVKIGHRCVAINQFKVSARFGWSYVYTVYRGQPIHGVPSRVLQTPSMAPRLTQRLARLKP